MKKTTNEQPIGLVECLEGIDDPRVDRDELLEKVLAYNCCRTVLIKQRRQEELEPAA